MIAQLALAVLIAAAPVKKPSKERGPKNVPAAMTPPVSPPAVEPSVAPRTTKRIGLVLSAPAEVPPTILSALEQSLASELGQLQGHEVLTTGDLKNLLGLERQLQLMGGGAGRSMPMELDVVVRVSVSRKNAGYLIETQREEGSELIKRQVLELPTGESAQVLGAGRPLALALFPGLLKQAALATAPPRVTKPTRVAVFDVRAVGEIPERALATLNQSLTPEVRKVEGISAIAASELRDMLGIERQKQLLGCSDETTCLEEMAGALDADELLTIDLTLVGNTYALTARRMDLRTGRALGNKLEKLEKRDGEELLAIVGTTIAALYPDHPLRAGRVRGVEPAVIRRLNPPPLPRWAFGVTLGATLATGAAAAVTGVLLLTTQTQYVALGSRSLSDVVPGVQFITLAQRARTEELAFNVLLAVTGGLAVTTVLEAFFTDWRDDRSVPAVSAVIHPGGGTIALSWSF